MVLRGLRGQVVGDRQRRRLLLLLVGVGLWCGAVGARLLHLQVVLHDELVARADRQHLFTVELAAQRGDIRDRHGKALAVSIELESVYAHPHKLDDREAAARLLAEALQADAASLAARLDTDAPFVWLQRKARPDAVERVQAVVAARGWDHAVGFLRETQRVYPHRTLAAHVLGFVDIDGNGQAGVEYSHDEPIRGVPGRWLTVRDGSNRPIDPDGIERIEPVQGDDLRLTIDSELQFAAEVAVQGAVEEHAAVGGSALVMDVRSGAVLAMASWPTFNPNVRDRAMTRNSMNRNIAYAYEPGSTFKAITAAAALAEGLVYEGEPIDCEGGTLRVANHTYRDWRLGFGVMPFEQVLMNSSNVGTIKVGMRLQPRQFHDWLGGFGFGVRTGIDLPGEAAGILHAPDSWSALSQSSLSIGYGVAVTPLQLARAFAAIANGGEMPTPYVVEEVLGHGAGARPARRAEVRRVLSRSTAARLGSILEHVVASGTGQTVAIDGYRIAGKTGTARKLQPDGRYDGYIASFAGFLPVDDPRVVIVVVLDEPTHGYYGSQTAGPAFREIAETAIRRLRIPPSPSPRLDAPGVGRTVLRDRAAAGAGSASSMP